jgi:hypothetical protein
MNPDSSDSRFDDITIFTTEDGQTRVEVRFQHENVWLTQKLMAELYECSTDNISLHLRNIFAERELDPAATTEESSTVQNEGGRKVTRKVTFYSLEAIIAVGYRVSSPRATQFRTWATDRLKDYILKGFAIDKERFKRGSRYDQRYFEELLEEVREPSVSETASRKAARSVAKCERRGAARSKSAPASGLDVPEDHRHLTPQSIGLLPATPRQRSSFFATVQNKLHFAITGHTAAELIAERADAGPPDHGPDELAQRLRAARVLKSDVGIAKNYLQGG